jgi:hypothetical protein
VRTARLAVVLATGMLAVLTIPVLAGCGSARMSSDPFVGTWQTGWGTELVIGKSASGYTGAWAAADTNPRVVRFTKVRLDGKSLFADVPAVSSVLRTW